MKMLFQTSFIQNLQFLKCFKEKFFLVMSTSEDNINGNFSLIILQTLRERYFGMFSERSEKVVMFKKTDKGPTKMFHELCINCANVLIMLLKTI